MFDVFQYRKKVIRQNLRNSFPDATEQELRQIASSFYRHFSDLLVETVKLEHVTAEEIQARMICDQQIIFDLYKNKKSAVFVLGHRGNWEIANLYASLNFPHETVVVYKPLSDPLFEKWFHKVRTQFGSTMIPMHEIYHFLSLPRDRPFLLFLVNDQSPNPKKAFWTRFLNQDTGVFRGVELISRQYNLPVVYTDIKKDASRRGVYELTMEMLCHYPDQEPNNGILQKQVAQLERDIMQSPSNWLWTHKRWKHKRPDTLTPEQLLSEPVLEKEQIPDRSNYKTTDQRTK